MSVVSTSGAAARAVAYADGVRRLACELAAEHGFAPRELRHGVQWTRMRCGLCRATVAVPPPPSAETVESVRDARTALEPWLDAVEATLTAHACALELGAAT